MFLEISPHCIYSSKKKKKKVTIFFNINFYFILEKHFTNIHNHILFKQ